MREVHAGPGDKIFLLKDKKHKLVCCGCGLVHIMRFDTLGAGIVLSMWEDPKGTKDERKKVLGIAYDEIERKEKALAKKHAKSK